MAVDFLGELPAAAFETVVELEHLRAERFDLNARSHLRGQRLDLGDRERLLLPETGEADALQSLQDQIRSAVAATDAGADQADGGDLVKVSLGVPVATSRIDQRDAKHAMISQRVLEHRAVAHLEDVERQERMREKQRAGERHDRDGVG